jgi:iron complex transport system substrate-binding protein
MRLISLAPSSTEILFELGVGDDVVATTGYCDYPDGADEKPDVGGWLNVQEKEVVRSDADAVFTSTFLQDDLRDRLEEAGLDVVHVSPSTLDEVYASIRTISEYVNREDAGQGIIEEMKEGFSSVRAPWDDLPVVYLEEWHDPPSVAGNWVPDIVRAAGGTQSLISSGKPSKPIEGNTVREASPDLIVLHWCGFQDKSDKNRVRERDEWGFADDIPVTCIHDSLLNRPGPRLVEGCKEINAAIRQTRDYLE